MSTSFTSVSNGDPLNPSQVNQFIAPINALEDAVAALGSPGLDDITGWPAGVTVTEVGHLDGVSSSIQTQLNGKAASSHTHAIGDTTGLQTALDGKAASSHTHAISDTTGLQTALDGKAASSHNHPASAINSGQVALANGGTGANLSATGGAGQVLKQASAGAAVTVGALAPGDMPSGIDATKIGAGSVSNTEFGYLDGVTSNIQAQIDALGGGGGAQLAIFARITSDQTGISGSYVEDFLQYNSEILDQGNHWTVSGDDLTCGTNGTYRFTQYFYNLHGNAFAYLVKDGSTIGGLFEVDKVYDQCVWVAQVNAGQVVKCAYISNVTETMPYTDGASRTRLNALMIEKVA